MWVQYLCQRRHHTSRGSSYCRIVGWGHIGNKCLHWKGGRNSLWPMEVICKLYLICDTVWGRLYRLFFHNSQTFIIPPFFCSSPISVDCHHTFQLSWLRNWKCFLFAWRCRVSCYRRPTSLTPFLHTARSLRTDLLPPFRCIAESGFPARRPEADTMEPWNTIREPDVSNASLHPDLYWTQRRFAQINTIWNHLENQNVAREQYSNEKLYRLDIKIARPVSNRWV